MDFIYTLFGTPLGWVMWAVYQVIPIYALALVIFTILSKVLLFPLAIKQHKASIQQMIFRPKMEELRKKYGSDKKKYQEEMLKLQQEEGMSLTGGCSSMLIQFPILFGLIDVIYKPLTHILRVSQDVINQAIEIAKALGFSFSGMSSEITLIKAVKENPAAFSSINENFVSSIQNTNLSLFGLDLTAIPTMAWNWLLIFPILMLITMVLQSYISAKLNPAIDPNAPGAKTTQYTMYAMSLMFVFFSFSVPTGVSFYWVLTNVLMIAQQVLLNHLYNPKVLAEKMRKEIEDRKKAKRTLKSSSEKDGKVQVGEKVLSQKDYEKLRLAKARQMDAELYGEEYQDK